MLKAVRTMLVVFGLMLVVTPVMAQEVGGAGEAATAQVTVNEGSSVPFSIPKLGASLIVIGAALGIGRIGSSAVESMARQPEYAGKIQTAMIIAAALIEGLGFAALFVG